MISWRDSGKTTKSNRQDSQPPDRESNPSRRLVDEWRQFLTRGAVGKTGQLRACVSVPTMRSIRVGTRPASYPGRFDSSTDLEDVTLTEVLLRFPETL